jgi:integrase
MSVAKRPDGRYRARYRGADGRERAKHFDRKSDALRWLSVQEGNVVRGDWVDPALGRVTVGEWAPTWLASKTALKPTSRRSYEELWRTRVEPRWGSVPLSRVTYGDVLVWVASLTSEGLSPSRVGQCLLVLKQLLDLAVLDGRISRNVAKGVKAPRPTRGEQRFLSHEQLARLAAECGQVGGDQYRTMVLLLGYTGLRWGEVRALRVKHLDLMRRRLHVVDNIPDGYTEADTVAPKSHRRRTVPLPALVADELAEAVAGRNQVALVFVNSAGGLLDNSGFRRNVFDPCVEALGLSPFTPHNLRDTAASLAVSAGANVKVVQRMLGHASAAMTLDVYSGLFADDLDQVAARLNESALSAAVKIARGSRSSAGQLRLLEW